MKHKVLQRTTISVISIIIGIIIGSSFVHYTAAQKEETNTPKTIEEFTGVFDESDIAQTYLKNGDFYSKERSTRFNIDSSYINLVDTALFWYDKVVDEYPNTDKANQALKAKMQTLIGWTDGYGDSKEEYGLYNKANANKYFPMIETSFNKLSADYPEDNQLEAYSYQIAQAYFYHLIVYRKNNYAKPLKNWLEKTIIYSNGKLTFYSHLADKRLKWVSTRYPEAFKNNGD